MYINLIMPVIGDKQNKMTSQTAFNIRYSFTYSASRDPLYLQFI